MTNNTDPVRALIELRTGVEMDAAYDPMGAEKLAALDLAIAALSQQQAKARAEHESACRKRLDESGVFAALSQQAWVDVVRRLAEVMPPKPMPGDDYGYLMSANHLRELHVRFSALSQQPAAVSALEVFRIAGGDTECEPDPTPERALEVLRDLRACYDEALASAPPSAPVGVKRWPFVESPGEFTERLAAAMQELPLIGAVRHVLIENPPALSQQPAAPSGEAVADAWKTIHVLMCVMRFRPLNEAEQNKLHDAHITIRASTTAAPQQPAAPVGVDVPQLAEQARAWELVFRTLEEVSPGWWDGKEPAMHRAAKAIRALAQQPAAVDESLPDFLDRIAGELVSRDTRAGTFAPGIAESLRGRAIVLRTLAQPGGRADG